LGSWFAHQIEPAEEHVRVTTAFNKLLALDGVSVASVTFAAEGVVIGVRHRRQRPICPCGWKGRAVYDRSTRRWRHLDLGASKLFLEAEVRRISCRQCGRVRTEQVQWARPGARHSRDFEDVVAWLCQRTDKTTVTKLLRTSWETVAAIVLRVVDEHIDERRLDDLYRIGIDEVSWRKGYRYLTVVADHDRDGAVVWADEGRNSATLQRFYDLLGEQRCAQLSAVSMDLGNAYKHATDVKAPQARQCVDPFHLVQLANQAVDKARLWAWNRQRAEHPTPKRPSGGQPADAPPHPPNKARWIKHTRWALVKDPDTLTPTQLDVLHQLRRQRSVLYRAWQLKEALRDLYRLHNPADAPRHLNWWLAWATRSRIPSFTTLARTVRTNYQRILAAIDLALSNSKLEGLNSKIRLINHRGYGHHTAAALTAMIYLCCGGITIQLPTQR
jgi:transposase